MACKHAVAAVVLLFAPGIGAAPKELATPEAYLVSAMEALTLQKPEQCESICRDALSKFPGAHGFHLLLGEAKLARNHPAEAYYELQIEALHAGTERASGKSAAKKIAKILEGRGPENDEVRRLYGALPKIGTAPKDALAVIDSIRAERGERFVLTLFRAEALEQSGDSTSAIALYRSLIDQDAAFVPAYVELALILEKSGKSTKEVDALLAKARSADPEHWRLKKYDQRKALAKPPATASP